MVWSYAKQLSDEIKNLLGSEDWGEKEGETWSRRACIRRHQQEWWMCVQKISECILKYRLCNVWDVNEVKELWNICKSGYKQRLMNKVCMKIDVLMWCYAKTREHFVNKRKYSECVWEHCTTIEGWMTNMDYRMSKIERLCKEPLCEREFYEESLCACSDICYGMMEMCRKCNEMNNNGLDIAAMYELSKIIGILPKVAMFEDEVWNAYGRCASYLSEIVNCVCIKSKEG